MSEQSTKSLINQIEEMLSSIDNIQQQLLCILSEAKERKLTKSQRDIIEEAEAYV